MQYTSLLTLLDVPQLLTVLHRLSLLSDISGDEEKIEEKERGIVR
jgi:hypothetical protein